MNSVLSVIVVLFVITLSVSGAVFGGAVRGGHNSRTHLVVSGASSSLNISSGGDFFEIQFKKIIVGGMWPLHGIDAWQASLDGMQTSITTGFNESMGKYKHIVMWKNTSLTGMGNIGQHFRKYTMHLRIDFYMASKNYTKSGVLIDSNTLRYAVHIRTDCPGTYVYLEHEVFIPGNYTSTYANIGTGWKHMGKANTYQWLNFSNYMGIGVGDSGHVKYRYEWFSNTGHALYMSMANALSISFVYLNSGDISQDPYIHVPFAVYVPEEVEHVVNYVMAHAYSIALGMLIASSIIIAPALLRKRQM